MKINLLVLFGGKSTEHEVSIITGIQAIQNLNKEKYNILPVYIDKQNDFYFNENNMFLDVNNFKDIPSLLSKSKKIIFVNENNKIFIKDINAGIFSKKNLATVDVCLPVVHGTNVEDGTLQGYLKTIGIPFAGCNVLSSAVGMDKYVMKKFLKEEGVPVLDGKKYNIIDYKNEDNLIKNIVDTFSYPVIIKPINLGSSIGISVAKDEKSLRSALSLAFNFSEEVVVERAITNLREINVSVLGDKYDCKASICEEPLRKGDILSFSNKYLKDDATKNESGHKEANIDEKTKQYIQKIAIDTFKAIGCSGVARVDCMIDCDTNTIYVNEINTIPGSLSFYLWEPLGIKYNELLDMLIKIALDNKRREEKINFSFQSNLLSNHKLFKNK